MKMYKATVGTNMTIIRAKTIEVAKAYALTRFGTFNNPIVTKATENDVLWARSMDCQIHEVHGEAVR